MQSACAVHTYRTYTAKREAKLCKHNRYELSYQLSISKVNLYMLYEFLSPLRLLLNYNVGFSALQGMHRCQIPPVVLGLDNEHQFTASCHAHGFQMPVRQRRKAGFPVFSESELPVATQQQLIDPVVQPEKSKPFMCMCMLILYIQVFPCICRESVLGLHMETTNTG